MSELAKQEELNELLREDPGNRGVADLEHSPDLSTIAKVWSEKKRILVISGFCFQETQTPETDGILGCLSLAEGFYQLGADVFFSVDPVCRDVFEDAGILPLLVLPLEDQGKEERLVSYEALLDQTHPDGVIFLEHPGSASDGKFYNVHGIALEPSPAPLEEILLAAKKRDISTLAFGDGGNEAGVGVLSKRDLEKLLKAPERASCSKADQVIMAGISDWGVFVFLTALSLACDKNLLPEENWLEAWLDNALEAGAVDGITGESRMTTDGISIDETVNFLARCKAKLD